jgi:hypothetical protein
MNHETQRWRMLGPGLAVAVVAAALAVGLFGIPLGSVLFVGLLLVCPLMMIGMHGGHGAPGRPDEVQDHIQSTREPPPHDPIATRPTLPEGPGWPGRQSLVTSTRTMKAEG